VTPVPGDLMNHGQDGALWRAVLGEIGPMWRLLADEPDDTTRN
jgi:hypothetical protein